MLAVPGQLCDMQVFVNSVDGHVGRAVCTDLRRNVEENRLIGTVEDESAAIEKGLLKSIGIDRLVSRKDQDLFLKDVLSCGLIVYDLHSSNIEEVEAVLKHLKLATLDHETIFVLISSVNVWAKTKVRRAPFANLAEENDDEDEAPPDDKEDEGSDANDARTMPMELSDQDLIRRIPAAGFEAWKYVEELALSLQSKGKLRTHVVSAGILYGNGETTFNELFKAGWLSQDPPPIAQPGTNFIPCIHVRDVARLVQALVVEKEASHYLVAVDKARHTQSEIVNGVMAEMADGKEVPLVPGDELTFEFKGAMMLDLVMKPSAPMLAPDFPWWCKEGIVTNCRKVADEFCSKRNLRPIRMVVWGPPGAGAENLCASIAERYMLTDPPHFTVDDIFNEILRDTSGRGARLKRKLDKVAKKPGGKLPLQLRTKLIKDKLLRTARYRGYVLDGYPTSYEEADALFLEETRDADEEGDEPPQEEDPLAPKGDGEGEEEEEGDEEEADPPALQDDEDEEEDNDDEQKPTRTLNKLIVPEFAVMVQSSIEECRKRIFERKAQGASQEAEFDTKVREYRRNNMAEDGSAGTCDFFEEVADVRVLRLDVDKSGEHDAFQATRRYMESSGPFFNYLKSDEERAAEKAVVVAEKQKQEDKRKRLELDLEISAEQTKRETRLEQEAGKRQIIAEGEAQLLEREALPLKRYLERHVVPTLTRGISEVCREMPEDPIEHLAQYLFAHAKDIAPQLAAEANAAKRRQDGRDPYDF